MMRSSRNCKPTRLRWSQRLHYFKINDGPWSQLDDNEPFIEGVPAEKPPQANFYPDDITKEEFNSWLRRLSADGKRKSNRILLHDSSRQQIGKLKMVPYSEEYREFLEPAAKLLREAAALDDQRDAKRLSQQARRCICLQRLLRQ